MHAAPSPANSPAPPQEALHHQPNQGRNRILPLVLASAAMLPVVMPETGAAYPTDAVAASRHSGQEEAQSGQPNATNGHEDARVNDYKEAESLLSNALAHDTCSVKVNLADVMVTYKQLFPNDNMQNLTLEELEQEADMAFHDFAVAREDAGIRLLPDSIQQLQLDAYSESPKLPVAHYLETLRQSAERWGIDIVTDWRQDKTGASQAYMDNAISPVASDTYGRRELMSIIRELETLPPEINQPKIIDRIVLGNIRATNVAGQVVLGGRDIYVDTTTGLPNDVAAHEIGHERVYTDCDSADGQDSALKALKYPEMARYANVDVGDENFTNALTAALAASGLSSIESVDRAPGSRLGSETNLTLFTSSFKRPEVAFVTDYGFNTPEEEQATDFSLLVHADAYYARRLFALNESSTVDTTRLNAGLALLITRTREKSPILADYQVASMRAIRVVSVLEHRREMTSDSGAQSLLNQLSGVDAGLRSSYYNTELADTTLKNIRAYYVDEHGVCVPAIYGGKGAG